MAKHVSSRIIEVVDYQSTWVDEFQHYAQQLNPLLKDLVIGIEHVGSTSVMGLAAKPIIDIDIIISSRVVLERVLKKLSMAGYRHIGAFCITPRNVAFHIKTFKTRIEEECACYGVKPLIAASLGFT